MSAGAEQLDLHTLLRETVVGDLVLTKVPILAPSDTLTDAADAMCRVSHGSAIICRDNQLVGIVTERDLLRVAADDEDAFDAPIEEIMTSGPQTVTVSAALADAVRLMDQGGYRRLPVVDDHGAPAGVIDVKTVVNFVVEHMPHTVYNQASRRQLTVSRREGA
ncbi:MAG: CBS domain-containing protein [Planctomycetaceae bacterium]|nr:CBS domain-containing protein [Planctomycetaceae bacterium]